MTSPLRKSRWGSSSGLGQRQLRWCRFVIRWMIATAAALTMSDRVMRLLNDVTSTEEPVGKFLWVGAAPAEVVPFRYSMDDRDRRGLDDVGSGDEAFK